MMWPWSKPKEPVYCDECAHSFGMPPFMRCAKHLAEWVGRYETRRPLKDVEQACEYCELHNTDGKCKKYEPKEAN